VTTNDTIRRNAPARIGICALNLLLPGLGLVRLAGYRVAGAFFALAIASIGVMIGGYFLIERMRFGQWAAIVGTFITLNAIALLGSIASSWQSSRTLEPRSGKGWRWYWILAIWAASIAVTWSVGSLAHSRYKGFYAPAGSMLPTIEVDDRFLADMHDTDPIKRGDVVIVRSDGYNFLGTACASTFVVGSGATSDVIGDDPMLGPLQDNGGPTLTHEPLEGSPVLEVVGRRSSCQNADQRLGARLPEPCDIGAVEAP